jgi:triacylglycerol lipase
VKDFWTVVKNKSLIIHHRKSRYNNSAAGPNKPPIIILPGIGSSWSSLKDFIDFAHNSGYPVYAVPALKFNFFSIPDSTSAVRKLIDDEQLSRVIIVGHSKGALIGKYVIDHCNQDQKILGLVAVAAPFRGSGYAKYFPFRSYTELLPTSHSIKTLMNHSHMNHRIISIYPEWDNKINSELGSHLQGARKNVKVAIKGHDVIMSDKTVWKDILEYIEELNNDPA